MKNPMNILSAMVVTAAALTVLPACKATSQTEPAPEPAQQVASAQGESGYKWFAKKGQRRGAKAPVPAAAVEPVDNSLQRVIVTGYCSCPVCCGSNATGVTASGKKAQLGTIAADTSIFPFGTKLNVPGYGDGVVEDTGSRVKGYRIDVWFPTHEQAVKWGSREMFVALP